FIANFYLHLSLRLIMSNLSETPTWAKNNPYLSILENRFFNVDSKPDWSQLPQRVARLFIDIEHKYETSDLAQKRACEIHNLVHSGSFFPNSPVMMNSESSNEVNLFACHVLSPPNGEGDLSVAKEIHDGCGGIGYDFSKQEDPVYLTDLLETNTESLNSGRKRKAHSAVTLHITHPKLIEFINLSRNLKITHTNIELDENFFSKLENKHAETCDLWNFICGSIEEIGKPAITFSENKNHRSTNGEPLILNVCGESLLRENESAIIGSLNLSKFISNKSFDEERFIHAARLAVRCLDNLHEHQRHASSIVKQKCMESRKIGVGIMGYADALLLLGLRYASKEALEFTNYLMDTLRYTTINESEILGVERGNCALFLLQKDSVARRNASLMAIPANGTLSLIGNVTGGIEPIFTYLIKQTVEENTIYQLQPTLHKLLLEQECDVDKVILALKEGISIQDISIINAELRNILITANELTPSEHIITQGTFQKYVDGGISKTINVEHRTTAKEIGDAILLAREKGCVGISLYRNGSVDDQPTQMM
ncbi:MAG: hypothetical protein ACXVED_18390, partial [Bacteroidia bacterium]